MPRLRDSIAGVLVAFGVMFVALSVIVGFPSVAFAIKNCAVCECECSLGTECPGLCGCCACPEVRTSSGCCPCE